MKSSGKGAVILPHGVLFRGGSLRQSGCASAADGVRMEVNPGYKLTEVGVIPEDWRVGTIGQISDVGRGRVISHREIAKSISQTYPVYSSQTSNEGVMGYLDTFDFDGEYITWTTDGANAGTVFYRNRRFNCTNVCGTIRAISDDTFFLSRALAAVARNYVSRNLGNPKLMNDIVKKVAVTMPSTLPEQHAIATALSEVGTLLTKLDQLIAKKRDIITGGNGNAGKKKCQTIRRARVRRGPRRG